MTTIKALSRTICGLTSQMFVNPECPIRIKPGKKPPKGASWFAAYWLFFGSELSGPSKIFLCEVTYSKNANALIRKLQAWNQNWDAICGALIEHNRLSPDWSVQPWLFVPEALNSQKCAQKLVDALRKIEEGQGLKFSPRITSLEMVQPWMYSEDRDGEKLNLKPDCIPEKWRV